MEKSKLIFIKILRIKINETGKGYYPSLIANLLVCPSHLNKEAFVRVISEKLVIPRATIHKPRSKDKTLHWKERKLSAAYSDMLKLAANSISGKLKDSYSFIYDPAENARMTLAGQMSLLMLMDMIAQEFPDMHFLQSNTDGFTMTYPPKHKRAVKKICKKWEKITKLDLEDCYPNAIYQRDGNNYIWDFGEYQKLKGAYEVDKKIGNELILNKDSSKRIVAIAVREYFTKGIPIENTITGHKDIYDFCIGKKNRKAPKKGKCYFEYQLNPYSARIKIKQTKVLRYYISNKGGMVRKMYEQGDEEFLEAGLKGKDNKGHYWKLRLFNKYKEKEDYDIDYSYYLRAAQKLIDAIEKYHQPPEEKTGK